MKKLHIGAESAQLIMQGNICMYSHLCVLLGLREGCSTMAYQLF